MENSLNDFIASGDLAGALTHTKHRIRDNPSDPVERWMLLDLFVVQMDWANAEKQLSVLHELDNETGVAQALVSRLLRGERFREEVISGRELPHYFGEPPEWAIKMGQALQWEANGKPEPAAKLREEALEHAPAIPGSINGEPFAWIMDADSRLGPIVEAFVDGDYMWIPMSMITAMKAGEPAILRELCLFPVEFTWTNGGFSAGFLPVRYATVEKPTDPGHLLSKRTDWTETAPNTYHGRGQRVLTTDANDYSILDLRELNIVSG